MVGQVVVLVEPERTLRRVLEACLAAHACRWLEAETLDDGARIALAHSPDVVLVDLDADGDPEACVRRIRAALPAGILLVGDPDHVPLLARCLDAGADEFVVKPFTAGELATRFAATLAARSAPGEGATLRTGALAVEAERRGATLDGRPVSLTAPELLALAALLRRPGHVLTFRQLAAAVGEPLGPDQVRTLMMGLRAKLEADPARPRYIRAESGIGYRAAALPEPLRADGAAPAVRS